MLTALAQAPLGVAIFDREMRYMAASRQFLTDQGLPGDTPLVGRRHYDVFPEVPQRWRDIHADVLRDGASFSHDADPFVDRDGRLEWIRWSIGPWRDEAGRIGGLVLYTEVVTAAVEARMALEAAEARYRAVFDQAAMAVARVAPDGRFLEVNDRFCTLVGYDHEELLELNFQDITHPEDLAADVARAQDLADGATDMLSAEKRYVHKSGEPVWAHLTAAMVRKASGEPDYFVSIIEDISARKAAEGVQARHREQLRLLVNELNHRVKNTLATVQSMASQTLRAEPEPRSAYEKFEARLMGLSQAHDLLTRERWHGADLAAVAERALRPFAAANSTRVTARGPSARLPPGAALTLALVLHELATNAVKYGALSNDEGRVALNWTLDEADHHLTLTWVETGGPPVRPPTRRGFGSRLIERSLKSELGGQAAMTYAPDGFRCALEAKLPPPGETPGPFDAEA
ncbi:PAS domain S-box protein [Phenylobacterium sp.]|uniref:sensor histidine kinase n=1 Tax=Phenylobacterium sp. TaxID=1871053 RepID=UPI0025F57F4C|nr:PAS domain S-box protein [Phenylobacterium sp.]